MNPDPGRTAKSLVGEGRAVCARNYQALSGIAYPRAFDSGAKWSLKTASRFLPFAWARGLAAETGNKLHAFTEFQNAKRDASKAPSLPLNEFFTGDPHQDIWRAEGLGARLANLPAQSSSPIPLRDRCSSDGIPSSFLLPLHTGGGLSLAEKIVQNHAGSTDPHRAEEILSEFQSVVEQQCHPALHHATFEALGLVLQTLYPDLLQPIADILQKQNPDGYRLVWHGAGRGHYFDPFQLFLPSRLRSNSYLADTDEAALNRLSGYTWAATMVNLHDPPTATAVLASLPLVNARSLAAAADGISAAALLWLGMTDDHNTLERLAKALSARRAFSNPTAADTISEAITRRTQTHPASPETLSALFSFDARRAEGTVKR